MAKILYLEDSEMLRTQMADLLRCAGYDVDEAATIAKAEQKYAASRPDVVLSDYSLRGELGTAFLRNLRNKGETVPALLLSGTDLSDIEAANPDFKMLDVTYLSKGLNTREVIAAIKSTLPPEIRQVGLTQPAIRTV